MEEPESTEKPVVKKPPIRRTKAGKRARKPGPRKRTSTTKDASNTGGRVSKLTPKMHKRICQLVGEQGLNGCMAMRLCKVPSKTFYHWLRKGRNEPSGIYKEFVDDYLAAEARFAEMQLAKLDSSGDNRDIRWRLEKRFPKLFGDRAVVEVRTQAKVESLLSDLESKVSREAYVEVVAALRQLSGLGEEESGDSLSDVDLDELG